MARRLLHGGDADVQYRKLDDLANLLFCQEKESIDFAPKSHFIRENRPKYMETKGVKINRMGGFDRKSIVYRPDSPLRQYHLPANK